MVVIIRAISRKYVTTGKLFDNKDFSPNLILCVPREQLRTIALLFGDTL